MKKIKIAYCIPSLYIAGGMERVLTQKANFLDQKGYEIHIIVTDGRDRKPYFYLNSSVKLHNLNLNFDDLYGRFMPIRVCCYQLKMRKLKKKLNACLCSIKPNITVSLLRRDINVINDMNDGSIKMGEIHLDRLHYRTFRVSFLPSFVNAYIERRWMSSLVYQLRQLSRFVVLTHEDAAFWKEIDNVSVIPNPVAFFPELVSDCTQKQVIAVGRLFEQKGFDRLISAWAKVVEKHPEWNLKIYGDGELREELQRQIKDLQLSDSCILEHSVQNIVSKYCESSIFVLSSRFEGFGLVIVEAMACGVPAISFACHCGPRDIIADRINGLLVPEGDIDKLATKICYLIEHEEERKLMGRMARQRAFDYRIENVGQQWIELFETLLREKEQLLESL